MSHNNINPILVEDWYDKSINNLRNEMQREGGLDWAIKGAWYLNNAPAVYWLTSWLIPLEIALFIAAISLFIRTAVTRGWTKSTYENRIPIIPLPHAYTTSFRTRLPMCGFKAFLETKSTLTPKSSDK